MARLGTYLRNFLLILSPRLPFMPKLLFGAIRLFFGTIRLFFRYLRAFFGAFEPIWMSLDLYSENCGRHVKKDNYKVLKILLIFAYFQSAGIQKSARKAITEKCELETKVSQLNREKQLLDKKVSSIWGSREKFWA